MEPPHLGHLGVIKQLEIQYDKVRLLLGSAGEPRSYHNPWTYEERAEMLRLCVPESVKIYPSPNNAYSDVEWAKGIPAQHGWEPTDDAHYVAPKKDGATASYLDLATLHNPHVYKTVIEINEANFLLHSRDIRDVIFNPYFDDLVVKNTLKPFLHKEVLSYILAWRSTNKDDYMRICRERDYLGRYNLKDYPPTGYCADLALFNREGDKVLMIQRGRAPGELLWALPGGFVEQDETTQAAAYREFGEETHGTLDASNHRLIGFDLLDAPGRSPRGRIASVMFVAQLTVDDIAVTPALPETLAVEWKMPRMDECFEDHWHAIEKAKKCLTKTRS